MSRKQPKEQHGIVPISIAIMFLIMAFGALSTMGGALLLRFLFDIRVMYATSYSAAVTFLVLLIPAGIFYLIGRLMGYDPEEPISRDKN